MPRSRPRQPTTPFGRFLADCKELRKDLDLILGDLERQSGDNPGAVRYAVDFSEIYAYAVPSADPSDVRTFYDDSEDAQRAVQRLVVRYLLIPPAPRPKPILLVPYLSELQAFMVRAQHEEFLFPMTQRLGDVFQKLSRVIQGEQFKSHKAELEAWERHELDEAGVARLVRYFENEAVSFISLLEQSKTGVRERIVGLLQDRHFETLPDLGIGPVQPDDELMDTWTSELQKIRRSGVSVKNIRDAGALATLVATNKNLADSGRPERIYLVSRAPDFRRLLDRKPIPPELAAPLTPSGEILRHPRAFAALHSTVAKSVDDSLPDLQIMRGSLDAFIQAASERRNGSSLGLEDVDAEPESARHIRQQWSIASALSTSLTGPDPGTERVQSRHYERDELVGFLHRLSQPGALNTEIRKRIDEMLTEIKQEYTLLGLELTADSVGLPLDYEWQGDNLILTSDRFNGLYTLSFHSDAVRNWLPPGPNKRVVSTEAVLSLLRTGFEQGADWEVLLCVAYLFGSMQRWNTAEVYSRLSIQQAAASGHRAAEAHFFLAVILRKQATPGAFRNFRDAWRELQRALDEMAAELGSDQPDQRYTVESAALILQWDIDFSQGRRSPQDRPPLTFDQGVELAKQGLTLTTSPKLRSSIYNNLAYSYHLKDPVRYRRQIDEQLEQLTVVQNELVGPDLAKWAPGVIDTVIKIRWERARPDEQDAQASQWDNVLKRAIKRAGADQRSVEDLQETAAPIRTHIESKKLKRTRPR